MDLRRMTAYLLVLVLLVAPPAAAELTSDADRDVVGPDGLTGRDLYELVVAHRLRAFYAEAELENGNGDGDERHLRFVILWKDYRAEDPKVSSKTRIEVLWPFDARFLGIQVIKERGERAQTFAYVPELRMNRRVPLRGERFHGSCFRFDDLIPPEAEDFLYRRLEDEDDAGRPAYRVELYPRPQVAAEHSRIVVSIDKARNIPIRSRYWSAAGELLREVHLPPDRVQRFDGSWFPMVWDVRAADGCFSTIRVDRFVANPKLGPRPFDLGRLESH